MEVKEKIKPLIARYKNKNWKPFLGETLPAGAKKFTEEAETNTIFAHGGCWLFGCIYYQGNDLETATDWIIIIDNGGYFKVNAEYMVWYRCSTGKIVAHAVWSFTHLKRTVRNLIEKGDTLPDPGYTT